jgi:hypothetical protein
MILLADTSFLEKLSYIATIVGAFSFFFAIIIFAIETKRRRQERELTTHDNLSKEYREFLKLCFENHELQVFNYDYYNDLNLKLSDSQKIKKYILFEILVSLLESAFFQYRSHANNFKKTQWTGWVQYMEDWCSREDFQIAWKEHLSSEFDSDFLKFMNDLINKGIEEKKLTQQSQCVPQT